MIDKTVEKDDLSDFYDYDDEMDWGIKLDISRR